MASIMDRLANKKNMKVIFQWKEGRSVRQTETEIPSDISWEEVVRFVVLALKKAYKYSIQELPEGITEGEL